MRDKAIGGSIDTNRAEGFRRNAGVKPSAVYLPRDFVPRADPGTPMSIEDMQGRAVSAGFADGGSGCARFILGRTSYQHISSYFPLFDSPSHPVRKTFLNLNRMMLLDRKYQSIMAEYIGLLELQLRSSYAREMSVRYGPFAHRNSRLFKNQAYFDRFLREYAVVVSKCLLREGSREKRDIETYGDMPLWEAVEEMSIGMISKLYGNTKNSTVKSLVADSFGEDGGHLESWLGSITFVRNRCAHYGMLLGSRLPIMPKRMSYVEADNSSPFYISLILMRLLRTNMHFGDISLLPSATMGCEIRALFSLYQDILPCMTVPPNWHELIESPNVSGLDLEIMRRGEKRETGSLGVSDLKPKNK